MHKILIFAGTTEGRSLAEFCAAHQIAADVSTATAYGLSLLPEGVSGLSGRLDADAIFCLLRRAAYAAVVDATHPYAREATENIRTASQRAAVPYLRLLRKPLPVVGESVSSLAQLTAMLNLCDDVILSTLGSKSVSALTGIRHFRERVWLRLLPSASVLADCRMLGFDPDRIILAKGPFSTEQNLLHIRQSGAGILLTKESGTVGGYPEKAAAAQQAGIRMITLCRPDEPECGYDENEIRNMLLKMKERTLR